MEHIKHVILLSVLLLVGCYDAKEADYYELQAVTGAVKDKNTGEPISDAAVMVVWHLYGAGSFSMSASSIIFFVSEALTDNNGYFEVAPPKRLPNNVEGFDIRMAQRTPSVRVFQQGYFPALTNNIKYEPVSIYDEPGLFGSKNIGIVEVELWRGDQILLKPIKNESKEYTRQVRIFRDSLPSLGCGILDASNYHRKVMEAFKETILIEDEYGNTGSKEPLRHRMCKGIDVEF